MKPVPARDGNNVTLVIAESAPGAGDGGSVLLMNTLDDFYDMGVDRVRFADNTTWTRNDLRLRWLAQVSTNGDDMITGFSSDDTINGGRGDDALAGADGNDSYVYARGDGNDSIAKGGGWNDRLVLHGITSDEVRLTGVNSNIRLEIADSSPGAGDGGSIILCDALSSGEGISVDFVVFDDGTTWSHQDLLARLPDQTIHGTDDADVLFGTVGNDTIIGGLGDDWLIGGEGSDTYTYASGDGFDCIDDDGEAMDQTDTLRLTDLNAADITLHQIGSLLLVSVNAADEGIIIGSQFSEGGGWGIEQIAFADGTIWDRSRIASEAGAAGFSATADESSGDVRRTFMAGDGGLVRIDDSVDRKVNQLVEAMAAFGIDGGMAALERRALHMDWRSDLLGVHARAQLC